jgi:hypothetical protein
MLPEGHRCLYLLYLGEDQHPRFHGTWCDVNGPQDATHSGVRLSVGHRVMVVSIALGHQVGRAIPLWYGTDKDGLANHAVTVGGDEDK